MFKQLRIHSFFKVKTSDEIEVEELLLNQISRASRTATIDTARSISTISTKIISIIDLSSEKNNIESLVNYESDSVNDNVIEETVHHQFNDVDSDCGVEYIEDAVFKALDSFIGPSVLPVVFSNDELQYVHYRLSKYVRKRQSML